MNWKLSVKLLGKTGIFCHDTGYLGTKTINRENVIEISNKKTPLNDRSPVSVQMKN